MPGSVPDAVQETVTQVVDKAGAASRPVGYLTSSALAGGYVGIAGVLLISASAPAPPPAHRSPNGVGGRSSALR